MEERRNNYSSSQPKLDASLAIGCVHHEDDIGKKMMVIQKDGKTLVGLLGSVDHYGNLFLYDAIERICVGGRKGMYGDLSLGSVLVRGDSLALTCEVDPKLETSVPMKKVPTHVILEAQRAQMKSKADREAEISKGLKGRGVASLYDTGFGDESFC